MLAGSNRAHMASTPICNFGEASQYFSVACTVSDGLVWKDSTNRHPKGLANLVLPVKLRSLWYTSA